MSFLRPQGWLDPQVAAFHDPLPERVFILGAGPDAAEQCRLIPPRSAVLAVNAAIALPVEKRWTLIVDGLLMEQPCWLAVYAALLGGSGDCTLRCMRLWSREAYHRLQRHELAVVDGLVEQGRSLDSRDPFPQAGVLRGNGTVVASALQLFWNLGLWEKRTPRVTLAACPFSGAHGVYVPPLDALIRALGAVGMVVDSLTPTALAVEVVNG
jgi:hypothetical protein